MCDINRKEFEHTWLNDASGPHAGESLLFVDAPPMDRRSEGSNDPAALDYQPAICGKFVLALSNKDCKSRNFSFRTSEK